MSFLWATVKVKDLKESIKFYQEIVGLKIERKFSAGPNSEIVFLKSEAAKTQLELISVEGKDNIEIGADISLAFAVESTADKISFLKEKGIEIEEGPISPNPEIEFFYILDPNGLRIQFVEQK